MTYAYLAAIVIILVITLVVRKNIVHTPNPAVQSVVQPVTVSNIALAGIEKYLEQYLTAGYMPSQLIEVCVSKGWDKNQIESLVADIIQRMKL